MSERLEITFSEGGVGLIETLATGGLAVVAEKTMDAVSGNDNHGWYCTIRDTVTQISVKCWGPTEEEAEAKSREELDRKNLERENDQARENIEKKGREEAELRQRNEQKRETPSNTPTTSSTPSTDENGCLKIVVYIVLVIGAIALAVWLAVNIVLPVVLLNSALVLTVLALIFKKYKTIFAALSLVGGTYMLLDIINGWLSSNFVQNVVTNPVWISVFVYINAVAIGLSTWLLMQPIWLKTNKMKVENKKINILYKALIILIVTVSTSVAPVIYNTVKNPFIRNTTIFINNSTPSIQKNALTDIDGNVYQTVIIGTQTWMVENLKTTKYNDGTSIPYVTDGTTWTNLTTPGYCFYDNDAANKNTYGALYNWYTVNTGKLAPTGWHVPTVAEWTTLENYLITNGYNYDGTTTGNYIAKSLAATTLWNTNTTVGTIGNDLTKNNTSGFAGLPGGYRDDYGLFNYIGYYGSWWNSTEEKYVQDDAFYCYLYYCNSNVRSGESNKRFGYSVRCLKD